MEQRQEQTGLPWHVRPGQGVMVRTLPVFLSVLVLAVALGVTWHLWKHTQEIVAQQMQARFDAHVREITDRIEHQLTSYVLVLRGTQGWLLTSGRPGRDKFRAYIDTLHLQDNYPGIQGIGYAVAAPEAGHEIYTIASNPAHAQTAQWTAVQDELLCRAAMERVRDPGKGFVTGKLALPGGRSSFLMCAPIYLAGARHDMAEFRHADIAGWVTMRFGMEGLMFGMLGDLYRDTAIAIHDGEEVSGQSLMYRNAASIRAEEQYSAIKHIEVVGHYWTLTVAQAYSGLSNGKGEAQIVLYAGIGISLLLSVLSGVLLSGWMQAIRTAASMDSELVERRRTEKELRLAATVYDTMDEAVTVTDSKNRFVSVNPAFAAITGYSRDEVMGKNPSILSSGLQSPEFYRAMWESLNSTGAWQGEISNRRKNGDVYVEWLSIKRIEGKTKDSTCHIAVFSDISKRKAAENLLCESRETLHSIIETAMDAVVLTDSFGVIAEWNARAEDIFGWSKKEACGRDLQDMIAPFRYQDGSVSSLRQFLMLRNGTAMHTLIETTAIHRDGHEFPVELTITMIRIRGRRAFSCFIHDVSARRARDDALRIANVRAEAASRAKSDFLANMSHEIRTPMNSILGMAYLTLKTELSPKQRDYLEKIHYSGQHLLGIINDILDFSKIEAGKLKIETVDLSLHRVVENITNMLGGEAAEKGLKLNARIDPDISAHLRGDPLRLGQVLINYVSNAIKFTEAGSVSIHASKIEEGASTVLLRFDVQDSGIGISREGMDNLFKLFQQADTSTTRKFGGTGLGLAISKQLAELMGGEVGVESEPGKGSTFWFTVLLEKAQSVSADGGEMGGQREQDAQLAICGAHILLVEDNHFNQLVATDLLGNAGVAVTIASNGKEAIDALRRQAYDCVLMDMQMPEMDGLEATRRIRADTAIAGVLIIAMTANTRSEDRESCIAAGMDDLITKPILPEVLYATLASHLTKQVYQAAGPAALPETQGDPEIIDLGVLARMVGHDREKIRKYAARFLSSAQEGLDKAETALASADMKTLAALGHRIKSSARTVGAAGFASLCQSLEQPGLPMDKATGIVGDMSRLLALINGKVEGMQNE